MTSSPLRHRNNVTVFFYFGPLPIKISGYVSAANYNERLVKNDAYTGSEQISNLYVLTCLNQHIVGFRLPKNTVSGSLKLFFNLLTASNLLAFGSVTSFFRIKECIFAFFSKTTRRICAKVFQGFGETLVYINL